jgi:hypothetical protein
MNYQPMPSTPPSKPLPAPSRPLSSVSRPPRFVRVHAWLRSRPGRIVVPFVALIIGLALGVVVLLLYGLSGEGTVIVAPKAGSQDIIVTADKAFITNLVRANLQQSGMPGTIENVTVALATGDQLTINADDAFSFLGLGVTKHFQLVVQLFVASCSTQIHIIHADLNGIPVTGFVQVFESKINQQLTKQPSGLPKGFHYCATGVRTQSDAVFVFYSAMPLQ